MLSLTEYLNLKPKYAAPEKQRNIEITCGVEIECYFKAEEQYRSTWQRHHLKLRRVQDLYNLNVQRALDQGDVQPLNERENQQGYVGKTWLPPDEDAPWLHGLDRGTLVRIFDDIPGEDNNPHLPYLTHSEQQELQELATSAAYEIVSINDDCRINAGELVHENVRDAFAQVGVEARISEQELEPGELLESKWTLAEDGTIRHPQDAFYVPMELVSRKLRVELAEPEHEEVRRILVILNNALDIGVNESTGLHVHVGVNEGRVPFFTARRLGLLVTAFEHIINQVHPEERFPRNRTMWADPNSNRAKWQTVEYRLVQIWKTYNMGGLIEMMNDDNRFVAYNYESLSKHGTIEFRQHAGSVDATEVMNWIDFCRKIFSFAHNASDSTVDHMIRGHMMDPSYTFLDLLRAIGASELRPFYSPPRLRQNWLPGFPAPWDQQYRQKRRNIALNPKSEVPVWRPGDDLTVWQPGGGDGEDISQQVIQPGGGEDTHMQDAYEQYNDVEIVTDQPFGEISDLEWEDEDELKAGRDDKKSDRSLVPVNDSTESLNEDPPAPPHPPQTEPGTQVDVPALPLFQYVKALPELLTLFHNALVMNGQRVRVTVDSAVEAATIEARTEFEASVARQHKLVDKRRAQREKQKPEREQLRQQLRAGTIDTDEYARQVRMLSKRIKPFKTNFSKTSSEDQRDVVFAREHPRLQVGNRHLLVDQEESDGW